MSYGDIEQTSNGELVVLQDKLTPQPITLELVDKPEGNQVLGNCMTSDDLCWKSWPLSVVTQKVIYQQPQIIKESAGPSNEAIAASIGTTSISLVLFLYLYWRVMQRVRFLERSIGKTSRN